jgi:hypothetical protein
MMRYILLKSADDLMVKVKQWVRQHRHRLHLTADYRSKEEIRLVPQQASGRFDVENAPGCTLSIRQDALIIACSQACAEVEQGVVNFLRKAKLIDSGSPLERIETFQRKNIRHDHERGRPVSEEAKAKRRERRDLAAEDRPIARFESVLEAAYAAAEAAGPWLVLHERAIRTAGESHYLDPDYVYEALVDLAHTARYSSDHQGLGMSWADFLGQLGSHDFVPNTSPYTIERYFADYHICHQGEMLCIQAHIRQGNGSAHECLRIYVVQPRKPGDPAIIGQIGAHLPTADRAH